MIGTLGKPHIMPTYHTPRGGLPLQTDRLSDHAVFTQAYAVIPARSLSDITTSYLPFWDATRLWVLARPMTGFAETFSHYIMEVSPNGGSDRPDDDPEAESVLFVVDGAATLWIDGAEHALTAGSYAFLPPGCDWALSNATDATLTFHWIRKAYQSVDGLDAPEPFVTHADTAATVVMPDTDGAWSTTRFVDPADLRHDMHVNIVNFQPGGVIPFMETHVMEHGLYVLEGKAVYKLNQDWVEVGPGDYMWLRAFCPQACYAGGPGPFRYLLYKDVNRHMML
jgi:(S)-ureidoglycine aminohydrolase